MTYEELESEIDKAIVNKPQEEKIALIEKRIKEKGYVSIFDARYLCERGIPAIEICLKNIPVDIFINGLNKWLEEDAKQDSRI